LNAVILSEVEDLHFVARREEVAGQGNGYFRTESIA
jgi:hypothetical protein